MISLDDHSFQLQWDSSLIDKGFKDLEEKFKKLQNPFETSPETRPPSQSPSRGISDVARIKQQEQINRARIDAEAKIASLQKIGSKEAEENIRQLTASIKRLDKAEQSLAKSTNRTDREFKEYTSQLSKARLALSQVSHRTRSLTKDFNAQKFASDGLVQSLKNLGRSWISVFAVMAGATHVVNTGRSFEDMAATLLLSSGNAQQAAIDFQYLTLLSQRLGLDINNTARAYSKFAVAGSTAGLANEMVKETFEDISIAIRATGLETQRANLAFLAFQQMLAGPVIQAQEMNQLVEQMPQFTGLAKKALIDMGHEVVNIRETIATGTVDSVEFVQRVSALMRQQAVDTGAYAKSLESVTAQIARLATASDLNLVAFNEEGFREGFADFLKSLTNTMRKLKPVFRAFGYMLGGVFKVLSNILTVVNAISVPFFIIIDAVRDLGNILAGGFNKELEKGAYITNFFKRTWMIVAGLIQQAYGYFRLFFANLQEAYDQIIESDDPLAIFSGDVGKQIDLVIKRSRDEGRRQSGETVIQNNNTFEINGGDPEEVRSIVEGVLQKSYSGAF